MAEFRGKLGKYKVVKTDDGSHTLWSEYFDENCHSQGGASEETDFNYVEGCNIVEKASKGDLNILEIGHGPGIGVLRSFYHLEKNSSKSKIHFVSTEIDPTLIEWAIENNQQKFAHYPSYSDLTLHSEKNLSYYRASKMGNTLTILLGNAVESIKEFRKIEQIKYNAIYQDAFSPKKNGELWSKEWFILLKSVSSKDVILSTYSSARAVRESLANAGWEVTKRCGFKQKKNSILAKILNNDITP